MQPFLNSQGHTCRELQNVGLCVLLQKKKQIFFLIFANINFTFNFVRELINLITILIPKFLKYEQQSR